MALVTEQGYKVSEAARSLDIGIAFIAKKGLPTHHGLTFFSQHAWFQAHKVGALQCDGTHTITWADRLIRRPR